MERLYLAIDPHPLGGGCAFRPLGATYGTFAYVLTTLEVRNCSFDRNEARGAYSWRLRAFAHANAPLAQAVVRKAGPFHSREWGR
jgi:hypothetical protein